MKSNSFKIATPISSLFNENKNAKLIQNYSDCLECRDHSFKNKNKFQELFHCEFQPIHIFSQKQINYLREIKAIKPELKLISFHIASCFEKPSVIGNKFFPKGVKISKDNLYSNAKINFQVLRKIFGKRVTLAVENNNYYKTEAYDYVTEPEFISKIVEENEINFLLDIAHAKISAFNFEIDYLEYLNKLPLDKMIQIHIAKPGFNDLKEIFDAHNMPSKKELDEVIFLIKKFPNVKYLTVEYYKNVNHLIKFLKELRIKLRAINGE